jgi:subtilisin
LKKQYISATFFAVILITGALIFGISIFLDNAFASENRDKKKQNLYADSSSQFDLLKITETSINSQTQSSDKILTQGLLDQNNKIPNQYIVIFKNSVKNVNTLVEQLSTKIPLNSMPSKIQKLNVLSTFDKSIKGAVFKISDTFKLLDIIHNPNVLYVEQDQKIYGFAQQIPKGINRIDADLSYGISGNGAGSINADIAIIDSGIFNNHPDLNIYKRKDFTGSSSLADDTYGHGSHVAGIAAAKDNSVGVVGVAPGARLWNLKILDSANSGTISNLIKALDYVTANAKLIEVANLSLGCQCSSQALNTAISNAVKAGVTIVAAAGNQGKDVSLFSPANNPNVITVSAIADTDGRCGGKGLTTNYGRDDTFASFSNYGQAVDVAAPGVTIYSTYKSNSYATLTGTSMASPHVAGAVALYKASHPSATPNDVINAIKNKGTKPSTICDNNGNGYFTNDKDTFPEPFLYVRNY